MEICLIDAEGLDEEIRCVMCRNPMRSDTGCDGGCTYDEKLYEKIVHLLNERIKSLPTIEPGRKTGRWIDAVIPNDNGGLPVQVCDQCNTFFPLAYTGGGHRYCPNCGAYMGGEQDGSD